MSTRQNLGMRLIEQRRRRIAAANSAPNTPTISHGTPTSSGVTLTGSAFSDSDVGDTHAASQWQVTTSADTGYASPVISTGDDATNKTSYAATGLSASTDYIARVRYKDSAGNYSVWSSDAAFSTTTVAPAGIVVGTTTQGYTGSGGAVFSGGAFRLTIPNVTVVAGENMLVVRMVGNDAGTYNVSYNGVPLTLRSYHTNADNQAIRIYDLLNPSVGTFDVVTTCSSGQVWRAIATVLAGVDSTTPRGTEVTNRNLTGSTTASVVVATVAGDCVLDALMVVDLDGATTTTPGVNQTAQVASASTLPKDTAAASSQTATGSSTTMSWTLAPSRSWVIAAVPYKAAP